MYGEAVQIPVVVWKLSVDVGWPKETRKDDGSATVSKCVVITALYCHFFHIVELGQFDTLLIQSSKQFM